MARPKSSDPNAEWNTLFQLAKAFYIQHNHLLIANDFLCDGHRLGRWIGTQRQNYRKGNNPFFTKERIELLESIGMIWNVKEAAWQEMWNELARYKQLHGTSRVPQSYVTPEGKHLGIWLNRQRVQQKRGTLLPRRKELLDQLNVVWNPEQQRKESWNSNYLLLKQYVNDHDGAFPPMNDATTDGIRLGQWLSNQRNHYKNGTLSVSRQNKLSMLGFFWDGITQHWEFRYRQAQSYFIEHGHLCLFLQRDGTSPKELSNWLSQQRIVYQKGALSPQQVHRLENIGMIWDVRTYLWDQMYQEAVAFYRKHGHLLVSKTSGMSENSRLGQWLSTQRAEYRSRKNPLFTQDRIQKLEAIGMVWDASVDSKLLWESWYNKAKDFFEDNGHLCPPKGPLRTWILAQRSAKRGKRGNISADQIQLLEDIGMIWEPEEEQWQAMYRRAVDYFKMHNMLNIPCSYLTPDGARLGQWLAAQRKGYRNFLAGRHGGGRNAITPRHIELLNQIGMIWDGDTITCHTSRQEKTILYYLKSICPDAEKVSRWQSPGFELDIYIPSLLTAIEYDGVVWHRDKLDKDEEKGRLCRKHGIRFIRVREPGLSPVQTCDLSIQLSGVEDACLKKAIREIVSYLNLPCPDINIARDSADIYRTYRDYSSRKWDQVYESVYSHYTQFGNLSFRKNRFNSNGVDLANWINTQRDAYRNDELTPLQVQKLEKVGMVWNPFESQWKARFRMAEEYHRTFGNLFIPATYHTQDGVALGSWLAKQREQYRKGKLEPRRIHLLEGLGVIWSFRQDHINQDQRLSTHTNWYRFYDAALVFYNDKGHLKIPAQYVTSAGLKLGGWLAEQRSRYRDGKLNESCIQLLESIKIEWNVFSDRWDEMFALAEDYARQNNGLWVSSKYVTPEGIRLGNWVAQQRSKLHAKGRRNPLTPEQKHRLDEIGMVWDPNAAKWMFKYHLAKSFYLQNGHLHIPVDYVTESGEKLGMWLNSQRQALRGNPNYLMTEERKRLLDEIGMEWNLKRTSHTVKQKTGQKKDGNDK